MKTVAQHLVPGANARGDRFEIIILQHSETSYGVGSYVVGAGPLRWRLRAGETMVGSEAEARAEANRQWSAHKAEFEKNRP